MNKLVPDKVVQRVKVRRVWRIMIFVDYSWKIVCTPFLGKVMGVRRCTVLLKRPIVTEHLIADFRAIGNTFSM